MQWMMARTWDGSMAYYIWVKKLRDERRDSNAEPTSLLVVGFQNAMIGTTMGEIENNRSIYVIVCRFQSPS
jgi:hypothetical protein